MRDSDGYQYDLAEIESTGRRLGEPPIGATVEKEGVRWVVMLLAFMRVAALLWAVKGLLQWAFIIGLGSAGFEDMRLSRQGVTIAFAVLDLVATTGLWMTSSWGVAVWLSVVFAEIALPFMMPDMMPSLLDAMSSIAFGLIYLFLVWKSYQEEIVS